MRRVSLAGLAIIGALLLAIPSAFAKSDVTAADPGITARTITIGGTLPADRPGLELRADPGRDEGVLQLHQRPPRPRRQARRLRAPDRLQVLRRRLQPGQLRPAAAQARRGGQGLRGRRHARHRGQPGRTALPELERRCRTSSSRPARPTSARTTRSTRGRSAGSPTTSRRAGSTARDIKKNHPNAKIAILYQNDSYGKDYSHGFKSALGTAKVRARSSARRPTRSRSGPPQSAARPAAGSGADTLMIFVTPTPTIQTYAIIRALGWKPANIYVNSVSATDTFMGAAVRASSAATVNGSISAAVPEGSGVARRGRTTRR